MRVKTTKSLERIEQQLEIMDPDTMRSFVLRCARDFKRSWIELGQVLHSVWKDKLYRDWGFQTFEGYIAKEIGIKKQTGMKLIRSYVFLSDEEPRYITQKAEEEVRPKEIPSYEAVHVLRQAKNNKNISDGDYEKLRRLVFTHGADHQAVKKDLTQLIKKHEERDCLEEKEKNRIVVLKRFISQLKSTRTELESLNLVPKTVIKQANDLIDKIEMCIQNG